MTPFEWSESGPIIRPETDYTCTKQNCYHCQKLNEKPREVTIMKPIYANEPGIRRKWSDIENELIAINIGLTSTKLAPLFPHRTKAAVANQLWIIRKRLDIRAPLRLYGNYGFL